MLSDGVSTGFLSFGGVRGAAVKTELLIGGWFVLVSVLGSEFFIVGNGTVGTIFFTSSELLKAFGGGVIVDVDDLDIVLVSEDKTFVHGKAQAVLTAKK